MNQHQGGLSYEEMFLREFAYEFENLQVLKIESTELVNEDALDDPDSGFKGFNGYYWTSINKPFHTEAVNWILS